MTRPSTRRFTVDENVALTVDVWRTEVGDTDPAAAFLMVHGLASNAQMWWGVAEELSRSGHACAAVDQRGHGRSDKPDDGYTLDRACLDLLALIEQLDLGAGPLVVAGQSWGANVALELGWRHPDRLAGVVCVDGGTIELSERFPDWESCASALAPPRLTGTPHSEIEAMLRGSHPDWPGSGIDASLANFETRPDGTVAPRLSFEHHMQLLRALWEHRPSTRYAGMKIPVLFVPADDGRKSAWVEDKRQSIEAAVRALLRAKSRWFAPADHDIHAQFPRELAQVLHGEVTSGILS